MPLGAALRYPTNVGTERQDYVSFTPVQYRSNASDPGSSNNQIPGGARERTNVSGARPGQGTAKFDPYNGGKHGQFASPPTAQNAFPVILYMPASTPVIGNGNDWQSSGMMFNGPAGNFAKTIGAGLAQGVVDATEGNFNGGSAISTIAQTIGSTIRNSPGIVAQKGIEAVAGKLGTTANSLLAVSKGIIFNPNVELLYKAPMFRSFGFSFEFVPANQTEANIMNQIILNFKQWSAPANEGAYFELPYVWEIKYMTPGGENGFMNKFKKAALKNISVQANPQTDMHVAHDMGVPISTSMSLEFMEVDVITRQDHERVGGQGY